MPAFQRQKQLCVDLIPHVEKFGASKAGPIV